MESTQELIAKYRGKVADNPDNELLRFSLGKALFDAGQWTEAEEQLKVALEKKPGWMVVTMLLAQCALKKNDRVEARRHYENALKLAVDQHHEGPEAEIRAILETLD